MMRFRRVVRAALLSAIYSLLSIAALASIGLDGFEPSTS